MHTEIRYADLAPTREERDKLAIADVREWLGAEKFESIVTIAQQFTEPNEIRMLNFGFAIAGIRGYPFHAFARRYCLAAYREWMHSGDDALATDDAGFPLEEN